MNRTAAERLAKQIELDIASGNFDYSLVKYKLGLDRPESTTIAALFDRYIKSQFSPDQKSSIERYKTIRNHFDNFQRSITVDACTEKKAIAFMNYLQECGQSGEPVNMNLTCIRAVWVWAVKQGIAH